MIVNFKKYFAILLMFFTIVIGTASWVIVGEKSFIAGQHSVSSAIAYIIGKESVKYTSIEKALDVAVSGDIVVVVPPKEKNYNNLDETPSTPDKVTYYITRDCEIKEGVSLVIPTDSSTLSSVTNKTSLNTYITSMYTDDRARGNTSSYGVYADVNLYLRVTVEVEANVTIKNNGTLVVGGYLGGGANSIGLIGQTSHSYSKIVLGENSKIIQNNANAITYCLGYIENKSSENPAELIFNNGKVYVPLIINDYRDFDFSWAMTVEAIEKNKCSPFNQLEFRNIQAKCKFNYLSSVYGISNLFVFFDAGITKIDKNFLNILGIIGTSNEFLVQLTNSSYSSVIYDYDKSNNVSIIEFVGGMTLNNLKLTLSHSGTNINLNTTYSYFPLSYKFNITLSANEEQDNAIFDITKQRLKLLPGSMLTVNDKCTLNAEEIIVYTAFYDGELGDGLNSHHEDEPIKYPIKDGAIFKALGNSKVNSTCLAGMLYGEKSNFIYTTGTITSKEPWSTGKNQPGATPAWIIDDYLEIREKIKVESIDYLEKEKIYAGMNIFTISKDYAPSYNVKINNEATTELVDSYQRVIHLDSISNYKIEFLSDIYEMISGTTHYVIDSTISYTEETSHICSVNSTLSISSNLNGNEFRAQSVTIECLTQEVNGQIPLFVGSSIKLQANVVDINKVYDKSITWSSSDPTIATVDNEGNVTGKKLGTTTISATCDGKTGTYDATVIVEQTIEKIESVYISNNKNTSTSSGSYKKDAVVRFTININPTTAPYNSIKWSLDSFVPAEGGQGTNPGVVYISGVENSDVNLDYNKTNLPNVAENATWVDVTMGDASGSDDHAKLICEVTDLFNNVHTAEFVITIQKSICFTPDTLVTMGDGVRKQIKDIVSGEEILSFNHYTGQYESTKIAMLVNHGFDEYSILNLRFNNGERLKFINQHGLFDVNLKKYVNITLENYKECIGRTYLQYDPITNSNKKVILEDINIQTEYTEAYSILSSRNINAVTNNILSMSTGTPGIYNIFELDDNYMVDKELMIQDIEKYGLVKYEEYKDYVPYDLFYDFNFEYLNISIAKGLITEEEIARQIEWYYQMIENGEIII